MTLTFELAPGKATILRRNYCNLLYAGWSFAVASPIGHGAKINLKHADFIAARYVQAAFTRTGDAGTVNAPSHREFVFCSVVGHPAGFGAYSRDGKLVGRIETLEVTKALAALQPLYGKDNIEIVTADGKRVRGVVRSMKTTQALTTPSVKIECANGEIVKIRFPDIAEIKDHNGRKQ